MDKQFFTDLRNNDVGLLENALPMITGAVAEPVAGIAAMYHAATGGHDASGVVNAIRDAMTYQPRTDAGKMYQQALGSAVNRIVQSAPVKTWQKGVDIAGQYSPTAGAVLQTVPAAIGVATGIKPALQAGRSMSGLLSQVESFAPRKAQQAESIGKQEGVFAGTMARNADLADIQRIGMENLGAPKTLNTGFGGRRGAVMFRGGSPTGGGGMTWVTPDLSHAEDYARYHGGEVHQVEHTPSSVFDAGRDVNELTPRQFAIKALQGKVKTGELSPVDAMKMINDYTSKMGQQSDKITTLWNNKQKRMETSRMLRNAGYDTLGLEENGSKTFAILHD